MCLLLDPLFTTYIMFFAASSSAIYILFKWDSLRQEFKVLGFFGSFRFLFYSYAGVILADDFQLLFFA